MNEYFLGLMRILFLEILWWSLLVWFAGTLGLSGVAVVSYFPVMILYSSIMSPLILRYASVFRLLIFQVGLENLCGPIVYM